MWQLGGVLDPKTLIDQLGLLGIFAIVFAESGLLIGFFLPGDSLLFTAGFLATRPASLPNLPHPNIVVLMVGCAFFAIAGDQVGYLFGRRVGPSVFNRPDSRFFKQRYVEKAQEFFNRHGAKAIVLARFVPVVRTFTPVLAGASQMHYRTFVTFNVIGGVIWGAGITALGYFLGQIDFIADNLEIAVLSLVVISFLPMAIELVRARRHRTPPSAEPLDRVASSGSEGT